MFKFTAAPGSIPTLTMRSCSCKGKMHLRNYALQDGKRTQVQRIQTTPRSVFRRVVDTRDYVFSTDGSSTRCASLLQRLRGQSLPMPVWPSTPQLQHGGPLPSLLSHVLMHPPFNFPLFPFATCFHLVLPQLHHFVERFFALLLCIPSLFFALFLECGNLIGIEWSSACDLRISRT